MVRSGTGFERHFSWIEFGEELFKVSAPDLPPQNRMFPLADSVNRENMLGRVD
jgi:hypothetical protein